MINLSKLILLLAAANHARATLPLSKGRDIVPGAYIVEFEDNQDATQLRAQAGPSYETRMDLNFELFKGVSIQLDDTNTAEERAAQLASLPAVKNIWPVTVIRVPVVDERAGNRTLPADVGGGARLQRRNNETSENRYPHVMTQIDRVHEAGITGRGIHIAIVDTGVDYMHPALGGCLGEGCLVTHGYDFIGDGTSNDPLPDDDPVDTCNGHGTHVAGIISARENEWGVVGAAPGASLSAYRVFDCEGYTTDDILIASFNRAYEDGADIITASIGGISGWPSVPWSVAASRIVEKGVPCTVSAGNDGGSGLFFSSDAAQGHGVTAIASFNNLNVPIMLLQDQYTVNNGTEEDFLWEWENPSFWDGVPRPLWVTGYDINNTADACEPLPDDTPDLSQFHVLIRRGNCDYEVQAQHVMDKGARWFISYNNQTGRPVFFNIWIDGLEGAAAVMQETGEAWVKALESGAEVITTFADPFGPDSESVIYTLGPNSASTAVSHFTTWGPTFEMDLKPQFGAVGGNIISTYLDNGFYVASGTSMSCPMAAAAMALLLEAKGPLEPHVLESLLASTAKAQVYNDFDTRQMQDWLAPPAQQGSGLIQVYDAIFTTTLLEPSGLSFNDTANLAESLSFTISNLDNDTEVTYLISHVPTHSMLSLRSDSRTAGADGDGDGNDDIPDHAELAFNTSSVTLGPGESAVIDVSATPPRNVGPERYPLWSGFITVNGTDGSALSLPYQGLLGSLYDAAIIYQEDFTLFDGFDEDMNPMPENYTWTLPEPSSGVFPHELPTFRIGVEWGSRQLNFEVAALGEYPGNTTVGPGGHVIVGKIDHGIGGSDHPRIGYQYFYDGFLADGTQLPAGRYQFVASALRIFGNATNPKDWIVLETLPFNIEWI